MMFQPLSSQEREEELRLLADAIEQDFPHLQRSVRYRAMLNGSEPFQSWASWNMHPALEGGGVKSNWGRGHLGQSRIV